MLNRKQKKVLANKLLSDASRGTVKRYGTAVKEHLAGYSGVDNDRSVTTKRSLKTISQSKVNPEYEKTNLKQQAGFSAEVKEVARRRAEEAISGKKPHTVRTDDIPDHVNDELYDVSSQVDKNGNPVPRSSVQMKFVGRSPQEAVGKLLSKGYQKYVDNDVKMMVPSDYYDSMKKDLASRTEKLEKQIERLKKTGGRADVIRSRENELAKCRTIDKNLVKSKVSNDEAMEARTNPVRSTVKDIAKVSHRAGIEQAKTGAAIGCGISIIRNLVAVVKKEKSPKEASVAIVGDTAGAAALSYAAGFTGTAIKGAMQNSASKVVRGVSKTNAPALFAVSVWEAGKTLKSYCCGEIDGVQCLEQLGEKGYGMTSSALFAVIGQAAIPIPVVGAVAGSMIGYALSSASYKILTTSLKDAKLARARRIRIEKECREAVKMIREYRKELEKLVEEYFEKQNRFFEETFRTIESSFSTGDVCGVVAGANKITEQFGKEPLFKNKDEFEEVMETRDPVKF